MPTISEFYGIIISMYYNDHYPPHIHARYAEYEASLLIETGEIIEGYLPARAKGLVQEWVQINRESLLIQWNTKTFYRIPPLK